MKTMTFILALFLVVALMAGPALAVGTPILIDHSTNTGDISTSGNPRCDIALSKNVSFVYIPDDSTAASAQSYAIGSRHDAGNKAYGTASDTTLLYWIEKTDGDIAAADLNTAADSSFNTGWTAM